MLSKWVWEVGEGGKRERERERERENITNVCVPGEFAS